MCGSSRERKRRSSILGDVVEIRYRTKVSRIRQWKPRFLRIGITRACLKEAEKVPCENERFASLAMSMEKTSEHNLISDVGTKSRAEDLAGIELRMPKTPLGVTVKSWV